MKVFKAEFKSGNWCYIFAESEDWEWHFFDDVMYECYEIKSFKELGKTIAGIVYVNSGVPKNEKLLDNNGTIYICDYERTSRWYELIWYYCKHYWWNLVHMKKVIKCRRHYKKAVVGLPKNNIQETS
mgnify:FL=1